MVKYPKHLQHLIALFKKFPGIGTKTAERFAFHLLQWEKDEMELFASGIRDVKNILSCPSCNSLMEESCFFCASSRIKDLVCIVGSQKDVFAIEETHTFQGIYYVLNCLLSPMEGKNIHELNLPHLDNFLQQNGTKEVILALDSTLEADATALYLKKHFENLGLKVTRLAFGLPLGSSLEYIDGCTLAQALIGRK